MAEFYSREEKKKILKFTREILQAIVNKRDIDFSEEKSLLENYGLRLVFSLSGEQHEFNVMPKDDLSLAENIFEAVEQLQKKLNLRFDDLANLDISIMLISQPKMIFDKVLKGFELGKDGLVVEFLSYKGIEFPSNKFKNKIEFLESLCHEAGLTKDSWENPNVKFSSFQTESFSEKDFE